LNSGEEGQADQGDFKKFAFDLVHIKDVQRGRICDPLFAPVS
jgi:hypothetical protein